MTCVWCGYSIGHAPWCQGPKGTAVRATDCAAESAREEYVEQLRRDKAKLIQDLAAEQKRREEAERRTQELIKVKNKYYLTKSSLTVCESERDALRADNARLREALEKLRDMQIVETLPIIEAALRPGKSEGGE